MSHRTPSVAGVPASSGIMATVFRNITSSWAALVVNTVISFVLAPIVVNKLGSVYYGIWTLLMQFTGYLWLFDFGVRESVIKYVAQYHASGEDGKLETTVRTAISVYLLVTVGAVLVAAAMTAALPYAFNIPADVVPTARMTAFVAGVTVAQSFLSNVFVGVLMGLQRIYLVSRVGVIFSLVRAAGTYLLLMSGYGLVGLAVLHLVLSLANAALVVYYCRVFLPDLRLRPQRPVREEVLKLLNYGKYVLISNIGDKIVFTTDAVVVGMFLPIAALTPYAIGGTLIGHMRAVVMAMAQVFNPLTSSLRASGDEHMPQRVIKAGAKGAMVVGLPLCIGFIALGELFVRLWIGNEHAAMAGRVLTALAIGYIGGLPYYTISGVLYGLGEHRVVAVLRIVEGILNIGLSVVLVNVMGLVGVAIGTSIPHLLVVGWILPRSLPKVFPFDLRAYYLDVYGRTLTAAVPFLLVTWTIRTVLQPANLISFFAWGTVSLLAYVVPTWFIALSGSERERILRATRLHGLVRRGEQVVVGPGSTATLGSSVPKE
jgi:O-antigen/teichoic acid export membrane protein